MLPHNYRKIIVIHNETTELTQKLSGNTTMQTLFCRYQNSRYTIQEHSAILIKKFSVWPDLCQASQK